MSAISVNFDRQGFHWRAAEFLALTTLCIAQLIESIDVTVVNGALPAIQAGLHFSESSLPWIVSAYVALFGASCCSRTLRRPFRLRRGPIAATMFE